MTIKHYYDDLKTADDLMSSNLHHKLSSVLRFIIPLVINPEQKKVVKAFYKRCEELPFANKGSEDYIVISRLSYEVLEYIEDNLL
ncbi:MAG: hypothetical protein JSS94_06810 [Bacteroidetes bacterium]|nr:hypothetical protein [Bacteroidota bacterium]